jgi:hypothetical protein
VKSPENQTKKKIDENVDRRSSIIHGDPQTVLTLNGDESSNNSEIKEKKDNKNKELSKSKSDSSSVSKSESESNSNSEEESYHEKNSNKNSWKIKEKNKKELKDSKESSYKNNTLKYDDSMEKYSNSYHSKKINDYEDEENEKNEIDEKQEKLIEKWARVANLWEENSEQILISEFGPMIAQGAEAKVYYRDGDSSVVKERTSIYSTTQKALDAIVLHNYLFPETAMRVIGFTRDSDGLMRIVLTQPYVNCMRLATKEEIDKMVAAKGFHDNWNGQGVNYISDRLALEDMHPANVFIDKVSEKPICIDCIVKFVN